MKFLKYIYILTFLVSCSKDDDDVQNDQTLSAYTFNRTIELGAVIACAASDLNSNDVLVFYYPEIGATNIRLYETVNAEIDSNDFLNYTKIESEPMPFFNGYLGKIIRTISTEKWVIITYELNKEIKISSPIRTKQISKPTIWTDNVSINQNEIGMPIFNWIDNEFGDNAIYFQVVSDIQNNLLSGTYTNENQFQYYNTSNVVLNITTQTPPELSSETTYNFTLMDVSEENWVNSVIENTFEIE